jgi:hypothetical protein
MVKIHAVNFPDECFSRAKILFHSLLVAIVPNTKSNMKMNKVDLIIRP